MNLRTSSLTRLAASAALVGLFTMPATAQTAAERLGIPSPDAREGQTFSVNGAEIFYQDSGEGDILVLLHGYPLSGALFERVRDDLDDDHRVITIDHRGYGNSTTPEPVTNVTTYAEDALAVLEEIGVESAVIGGMSMGGPIMFEMYRQAPEVFEGMVLIDTNHMAANPIEKGIWTGAEAMLNDSGEVSSIIPVLMPDMLTGKTRIEEAPAQVDYLTAAIEQASLDGAIGGAKVLAERPDSTDTLRGLEIPALVLVGLEDSLYPVELARAMADLIPNAEISVIDGAAHAAIFEQPEASAQAIREWIAKMK